MRHLTLSLACALALAPVAFAAEHPGMHEHPAAEAAETGSYTGEVMDMACYMGHGAKGGKHAKCAKACVVRGTPAGLMMADGTIYLLLEDHENPKPFAAVRKLAGEKAKVAGKLVEKGGIKALLVSGAEKA